MYRRVDISDAITKSISDPVEQIKAWEAQSGHHHLRSVASGFAMANGVTYSPPRSELYIASSMGTTLHVYGIKRSGALQHKQDVELDFL